MEPWEEVKWPARVGAVAFLASLLGLPALGITGNWLIAGMLITSIGASAIASFIVNRRHK